MARSIFLIFVSILTVAYIKCDNVKTEKAKDFSYKERKAGTLMSVEDCFSLYLLKGSIEYDGSERAIKDFHGRVGSCFKSNDTLKKSEKNLEQAEIEFEVSTDLKELSNIIINIKTIHDPRAQYWKIDKFVISAFDNETNFKVDSYSYSVPSKFSFSCMNLILNRQIPKNDGKNLLDKLTKITLNDFQIQPFNGTVFVESVNCATWFTIGTFCGLLILIFFTTILAFGIFCIMNIKTNDRFENPKGKSLQLGNTDN